jgi:sensor histidine kinase YesM
MVRDTYLRILFIPLLGMSISYISAIITYEKYSQAGKIAGILFFVFASYCIWKGCHWLHLKLRNLYAIDVNPFIKITSLCIISSLYGAAVACFLCLLWMRISHEQFNWFAISKFILLSVMAVILFTLLYEVLYLSKERERDNIIVDQLDNELTRVEVAALRNELDPHFVFNSLNTLSYLISADAAKADLFTNKLAHVYKYFLINKDQEQVSLEKELNFIDDYFFLIQIRHENKVELKIDLDRNAIGDIMIIPCAIQLLIENAIKHNEFTASEPLKISVSMDKEYLKVENPVSKKKIHNNSTKIGLRNLGAQYILILKKNIIIDSNEKRFIVKLPLTSKSYLA